MKRGRPSSFTEQELAYLQRIAAERVRYRKVPSTKQAAYDLHRSKRTIEARLARMVEELLRDDRSNRTSQITTMV
jgi:hypothetical protein